MTPPRTETGPSTTLPSRRTVTTAGAWAAPVIIVAAQANQVATSPCPTVVSWATGERGAGDVIRTKGTDAPGSVDVSIDGWNTGDHAIWRVVYGTLKDQDDVQITFTVTDTSSVLEGVNEVRSPSGGAVTDDYKVTRATWTQEPVLAGDGTDVTWTVDTMPAGSSVSFNVTVSITSSDTLTISSKVSVSATQCVA